MEPQYWYIFAWTCPGCGAESLIAHPERDVHWTDHVGPSEELMACAPLARCASCGALDLPKEGQLTFAGGGPPEERERAVVASEDDLLEALQRGLATTRADELRLRLAAWRASNDRARVEARAQIRSLEAERNLETLYDLLEPSQSETLLKAEVARELGRHAECLELLESLPRLTRAQPMALEIAELARSGSDRVGPVRRGWESQELFTCPHCGRRGRLDPDRWQGWEGFGRWLPYGISSEEAVGCGSCKRALWLGDALRPATRLERAADGRLVAFGCLMLPLALVLTVIAGKAGAVCLFLFAGCLILDSLLKALVSVAYPTSVSLDGKQARELLAAGDYQGRFEERTLRLVSWSDSLGEPEPSRREAEARLLELLSEGEPDDLVLRAEVLRRVGRLEEAIAALDHPRLEGSARASMFARELALELERA